MSIRYCTVLALRDTLRLKGPLAASLMIVLGVCLPLLLLQGLTSGEVRQQEARLLASPTATLVQLWTASDRARPLDDAAERDLEESHPGIRLVLRDSKKVLGLRGAAGEARAVTCLGTRDGDPALAFH